jgi:hypothetical protein
VGWLVRRQGLGLQSDSYISRTMSRQDKRVDVVLAVELHRSCDWSNLRGGLGYGKYVNGCRACGCVKWLCDLAQMWGVLVPAKGEEKRPISDPFSNGMYGTNVRFLRYVERTRPNQTLTPTRPLPISDYRLSTIDYLRWPSY